MNGKQITLVALIAGALATSAVRGDITTNRVSDLVRTNNNVVVYFDTVASVPYRVQATTNMMSGAWSNVNNTVTIGNGSKKGVTDYGKANDSQRYYRVLSEQVESQPE